MVLQKASQESGYRLVQRLVYKRWPRHTKKTRIHQQKYHCYRPLYIINTNTKDTSVPQTYSDPEINTFTL